ncbi:MAG: hypothetical protein CR971_01610 [candidate division SR1 bacterium]|nr:MAG: hypothetical protein CR971_01610 [candidate division SR1 bacterium]
MSKTLCFYCNILIFDNLWLSKQYIFFFLAKGDGNDIIYCVNIVYNFIALLFDLGLRKSFKI